MATTYDFITYNQQHVRLRRKPSFSEKGGPRCSQKIAHISKPNHESFQRSLFRHRKKDGNPLAWSGQHLHLKEVRAFFAWLTKQNHLPFNPAAEIDLPKQPKTLPKAILSADEVERILAEPDINTPLGLRDRAILETFYSTGIRYLPAILGHAAHEKMDTTQIYTRMSLRKLLEVHGATHPAERPEVPPEE